MEMFLTDSDCDSSSDSSSDYLDDIDSMYGGHAQSIFSSLERTIGKIDDFLAFERGFVHGDIVCSETDPSGQLGRVMDVDILVDLETVEGRVIRKVNSKKISKIRSMVVGDYVIRGSWLGKISKVVDRLTILFDDGAKCEVIAGDPENLIPISPSVLEESHYPYYPGQRVRIRYSSVFKSARWLCGVWKDNRAEGVVCHVEAGLVYVDWVASAMVGCDSSAPAPRYLQDSEDLTLLCCFSHANWELGDWCTLPVDDEMLMKDHLGNAATAQCVDLGRGPRKRSSDTNSETIYVIVKRKTKIDVLWQDGTYSSGLDSQTLLPVNSVGDHEFWPDQFVLEKATCDDLHVSGGQRLGIVETMDAKERTVKLKWKNHPGNQTDDSGGGYSEEIVSAYELVEHPDYSYCLGDIVFRLWNTLAAVEPDRQAKCEGQQIREMKFGSPHQHEDNLTSKKSSEGHSETLDRHYLSFFGNVIGYKDEGIIVRWATGLTSKVGPYEIAGIDKAEESVSAPAPFEEDTEDGLTREMPMFEKQISHHKEKDVLENPSNGNGEEQRENIWTTSTFFPRAAIGFFTNITASLFGFHGSTSLSDSLESKHPYGLQKYQRLQSTNLPSEDEHEIGSAQVREVIELCNMTNESAVAVGELWPNLDQKVLELQENEGLTHSSSCEKSGHFKQFDIVKNFSDHHFACSADREALGQIKSGWLKNVQREWSILEKDLPGTIYVRVYEDRIDLLRAAIFGAPGTPYHDGVFFFDFLLPPDFPHEPPLVHFNSGGLRLNPNLYESGRVCLSLLNTWTGTGTEAWNPGSSTILQVLLSLQALVLNEKPYFNEAGYDKQVGRAEGEKNSMTYNENAFITSCKYMTYVHRKPPKHFEQLVEEHFCSRAHSILFACKAYMDGTSVGCAFGSGIGDGESQKSSSTGFKLILAKLFPKLVSGFADKGIDCSQFQSG